MATEFPGLSPKLDDYPVTPGNDQLLGTRERQEDRVAFSDFEDIAFVQHGGYLGVVADGMGGFFAGAEASSAAVVAFLENYSAKAREESIPDALTRALAAANNAVYKLAASPKRKIGTTLTAAVVHEGTVYWISVGDSRAYLKRGRKISCLTQDHIFARELDEKVAAQAMSATEAVAHPDRAALTSYLGEESVAHVCRASEPLSLEPGDYLLLCSDGVSGVLSDGELIDALNGSAQEAAETVIASVRRRAQPRQDNASAAVLAYAPVESPVEMEETSEIPSARLRGLDSAGSNESAPSPAITPFKFERLNAEAAFALLRQHPWAAYFAAVMLLITLIWCCA